MEYKVNNLLYASGSDMIGTLRCVITLNEPVNEHIRNDRMIRNMDLSQKQEYMKKAVLKGIGTNTFEISYTGRVSWGEWINM